MYICNKYYYSIYLSYYIYYIEREIYFNGQNNAIYKEHMYII